MLKKCRFKLNHYAGYPLELFGLETAPEELADLASDPDYAIVLSDMGKTLRSFVDIEDIDALAFADQAAMIVGHNGARQRPATDSPHFCVLMMSPSVMRMH
jgi:choline-sulfatase